MKPKLSMKAHCTPPMAEASTILRKMTIRQEKVSQNTSLTGVPVKVGQSLKNHIIFCSNEINLKNSVDIL